MSKNTPQRSNSISKNFNVWGKAYLRPENICVTAGADRCRDRSITSSSSPPSSSSSSSSHFTSKDSVPLIPDTILSLPTSSPPPLSSLSTFPPHSTPSLCLPSPSTHLSDNDKCNSKFHAVRTLILEDEIKQKSRRKEQFVEGKEEDFRDENKEINGSKSKNGNENENENEDGKERNINHPVFNSINYDHIPVEHSLEKPVQNVPQSMDPVPLQSYFSYLNVIQTNLDRFENLLIKRKNDRVASSNNNDIYNNNYNDNNNNNNNSDNKKHMKTDKLLTLLRRLQDKYMLWHRKVED